MIKITESGEAIAQSQKVGDVLAASVLKRRTYTQIELEKASVTGAALVTLLRLACEFGHKRIVVRRINEPGPVRIFCEFDAFVASFAGKQARPDRFARRPAMRSRLPQILVELIAHVSERACADLADVQAMALGCELGGRFLISKPVRSGADFVVLCDGGSLRSYVAPFTTFGDQLFVTDHPDAAYGRWIAEAYQQVLHSSEPLVEDVECIIRSVGRPPVHQRYSRVVLPIQLKVGGTVLLSASPLNSKINLGIEVGGEIDEVKHH